MLGEHAAVVLEVKPFDLHGVKYADVTVKFDGSEAADTARLGPEAVPEGLQPGERVLAMRAANMIVSLRRVEP